MSIIKLIIIEIPDRWLQIIEVIHDYVFTYTNKLKESKDKFYFKNWVQGN